MHSKHPTRRNAAFAHIDLAAVMATVGIVAALQYGTTFGARPAAARMAYSPSRCGIAITSVSPSPTSIDAGASSTVTVNLASNAPTGGCSVDMSYTNSSVLSSAPSSLTVAGGSSSGSVQVTAATPIASDTQVQITATDDSNNASAYLTVIHGNSGGSPPPHIR